MFDSISNIWNMVGVRKFGPFYGAIERLRIGLATIVCTIKNLTRMITFDMGEPSLFYNLKVRFLAESGLHTA